MSNEDTISYSWHMTHNFSFSNALINGDYYNIDETVTAQEMYREHFLKKQKILVLKKLK